MQSHVESSHRMGTPIHGQVDPTVKQNNCQSRHYAHTTKRPSMHNQITSRFLWVPYRFSRFHTTASIRCKPQDIINEHKFLTESQIRCHNLATQTPRNAQGQSIPVEVAWISYMVRPRLHKAPEAYKVLFSYLCLRDLHALDFSLPKLRQKIPIDS